MERCLWTLIEWARRQRGLIVSTRFAGIITSIADLKDRTIVPRQAQAGAQALLLNLLAEHGVSKARLSFTAPARSEADAVTMVQEGKADVTFGLQVLAAQYKLPFVPIVEERFDLLVSRRAWFEPPMQTLLRFCTTAPFVTRAAEMAGYDISGFGAVHFNGA